MGLFLFLLFVGVPLIEIALFIEVGGMIGLGPTLVVVVVTAFLGSFLLRQQGLSTYRRARVDLNSGSLPVDQVVHGLFLLVAGALLLTPGFLTDGIGFLLFVPPIRLALGSKLLKFLAARGEFHMETHYEEHPGSRRGGGTIIDAEVIDPEE